MYRNTYVEINLSNLYDNALSVIKSYGGYKYYIGVVKSNFYGHGSYSVNELIKAGVNYLAVSNLLEAKNIRKYNKEIPILCLEPIGLKYVSLALELGVTFTVSSLDYLKKLRSLGKNRNLKIHLKINSGMNRLGFSDKNEVVEAFTIINEYFTIEGIYSHFHSIGYLDKSYDKQVESFKDVVSLIDLSKIKMVHLGKSASLVNHEKLEFCNSVRLGIILYGVDVSINKSSDMLRNLKNEFIIKSKKISEVNYGCKAKLKSSLSFFSEVIEVNFVTKGSFVGYGFSYKTNKDGFYAVVSAGYADGLKINGKNRYVVINNKKYEIINVTSGMIIIKVNKSVKVGSVVEIYGSNVNLKYNARKSLTNTYDLYSSLHESIPRVYTKNGKEIYSEIWEVM